MSYKGKIKKAYQKITEMKGRLEGIPFGFSEYSPLTIICDKGHKFQLNLINLSVNKWCSRCPHERIPIRQESAIAEILKARGISFKSEYRFDYGTELYFDFYFDHDGKKILLDYDDESYFIDTDRYFDFDMEMIEYKRNCSILKARLAIKHGFFYYKIDFKSLNDKLDVEKFIIKALKSDDKIFTTNPSRYEWLDIDKKIDDIKIQYVDHNIEFDGSFNAEDPIVINHTELVRLESLQLDQLKVENQILGTKGGYRNICRGYMRVSIRRQHELGYSLSDQEFKIYKWAKANNDYIIEMYDDLGVSGANHLSTRPGLKKLLDDFKMGECLIITSPDRLTRILKDSFEIKDIIDAKKGSILGLSMCFSTNTIVGNLMFQTLIDIAEYEHSQLPDRITDASKLISTRRNVHGKLKFGWKYIGVETEPVMDEDEQNTLTRIKKEVRENPGISLTRMCEKFNSTIGTSEYPIPGKREKWYPISLKTICLENGISIQNHSKMLSQDNIKHVSEFLSDIDLANLSIVSKEYNISVAQTFKERKQLVANVDNDIELMSFGDLLNKYYKHSTTLFKLYWYRPIDTLFYLTANDYKAEFLYITSNKEIPHITATLLKIYDRIDIVYAYGLTLGLHRNFMTFDESNPNFDETYIPEVRLVLLDEKSHRDDLDGDNIFPMIEWNIIKSPEFHDKVWNCIPYDILTDIRKAFEEKDIKSCEEYAKDFPNDVRRYINYLIYKKEMEVCEWLLSSTTFNYNNTFSIKNAHDRFILNAPKWIQKYTINKCVPNGACLFFDIDSKIRKPIDKLGSLWLMISREENLREFTKCLIDIKHMEASMYAAILFDSMDQAWSLPFLKVLYETHGTNYPIWDSAMDDLIEHSHCFQDIVPFIEWYLK
jgi:DNA invertase Pin-like site-specific DNA recombinase